MTLGETLSRTAFPAALKTLGLKGEPNAYKADASLPANVEDRLSHLGFVENLTAVRDLHESIRTDAESPARLGALARGYAQLGVLSEFQWHPAHKAFKARALRSPEGWAYEMIAENYKAEGNEARWKETLDDYLAHVEDHGLHHAHVQVEIANHALKRSRPTRPRRWGSPT